MGLPRGHRYVFQGDQGETIDVHRTRGRRTALRVPSIVTHILERRIAFTKALIDDRYDVPSRNDPLSLQLPSPAWLWLSGMACASNPSFSSAPVVRSGFRR